MPRPARSRRAAARAGEHHRDIGIGMAAEPFLAVQAPALDAVGADTDALGLGLDRADVRAAGLLGHELRALQHRRRVLAQQPVEQQLLQRRRAVALDDEVGGVGHRDRAHQAELGLHEEIGDGVLHQRMRRLRSCPARRRDGSWRACRIRRTRSSPSRDRTGGSRSSPRRGRSGRAAAAPADACRRSAPARRAGCRPARPAGRNAASSARAGRAPCRATSGPGTAGRWRRNSARGCRARCSGRRAPAASCRAWFPPRYFQPFASTRST